jgi:hypothetical protein
MILIAHRGNLNGPNKNLENHPDYILQTLNLGYECEIDVRYINEQLFLGHDNPDYKIEIDFLIKNSKKLWIHCKNIDALDYLLDFEDLNIFWHQEDEYTLTSKGYVWSYPKMKTITKSIILMPEWNNFEFSNLGYGICSDYIYKLEKLI